MIRTLLGIVLVSLVFSHSVFGMSPSYYRARCAVAIAYELVSKDANTSDACETCNGQGEVGDGVTMTECEDCNGTGKKPIKQVRSTCLNPDCTCESCTCEDCDCGKIAKPPAEPIRLPPVSMDVDNWDASEVAEAFVTHIAKQQSGFEVPVGGLFDKKVEAPAFVPALLKALSDGKKIKIPSAGATVSWVGDNRSVSMDGGGAIFRPPVTVSITKWGLSVSTGLTGLDIGEDGKAVTLLLRRAPDLTLNLTSKDQPAETKPASQTVKVPARTEYDFVQFVIANYQGTDYVETGTSDARVSHLVNVHGWDKAAISNLSRHQRRRLHGASHTGQVDDLRRRWESGGASSSLKPVVQKSSGRWVTKKFCTKDGCFTQRVWVSN